VVPPRAARLRRGAGHPGGRYRPGFSTGRSDENQAPESTPERGAPLRLTMDRMRICGLRRPERHSGPLHRSGGAGGCRGAPARPPCRTTFDKRRRRAVSNYDGGMEELCDQISMPQPAARSCAPGAGADVPRGFTNIMPDDLEGVGTSARLIITAIRRGKWRTAVLLSTQDKKITAGSSSRQEVQELRSLPRDEFRLRMR